MTQHFDDPVAAYQRLGSHYAEISSRRDAYLRSVEALIVERIPSDSRSLLDVGSGDGARAIRMANKAAISRVVLLEPAEAMIAGLQMGTAEHWPIRAEDLHPEKVDEQFDVVTCLWNVFGHIPTRETRVRALRGMAGLLSDHGVLFLDMNHRYNVRSYGVIAICARWMHDAVVQSEKNGDAVARWKLDGGAISTYGHVFTHGEVMNLARSAGLELRERIVVDYSDGSTHRLTWMGNLLYVFRRASRMDSSSALQTS